MKLLDLSPPQLHPLIPKGSAESAEASALGRGDPIVVVRMFFVPNRPVSGHSVRIVDGSRCFRTFLSRRNSLDS